MNAQNGAIAKDVEENPTSVEVTGGREYLLKTRIWTFNDQAFKREMSDEADGQDGMKDSNKEGRRAQGR